MLFAASVLESCPVRASDGDIGAAKDFLFDDETWKIRWMAVDAGHWLPGRRVFIHPSAIAPLTLEPKPLLPMMSRGETLELTVNLTKEQVEAGPHSREDDPVTTDMEALLYDYYGWDPYWGATRFAVLPNAEARVVADAARREADAEMPPVDGDPPLRGVAARGRGTARRAVEGAALHGVAAIKGHVVHALDGDIGHVENLLTDDTNWEIRYLIIATRNWWPGKIVQLAPYAVKDINWFGQRINMNVSRDQVRSAPAWDPLALADEAR
jgi:hypothetical protein